MFRLIIIIYMFFGLSLVNANADDIRFGWNIGNIGITHEVLDNSFDVSIEFGHFNWFIANKFSIGFNLFNIYIHDYNETENNLRHSILPLEIAFVPINYENWLFGSIYGKTGFELIKNANDEKIIKNIFGAIGVNIFIFPEIKYNYSPYMSAFIEYNTHNEFKIGIKIDLSAILYFWLMFIENENERKYNNRF